MHHLSAIYEIIMRHTRCRRDGVRSRVISRAISRALLGSPRVTAASVASASSHAETAPTESVHAKWSSAQSAECSLFTNARTCSGACRVRVSRRLRRCCGARGLFIDGALFIGARLLLRVAGDEVGDERADRTARAEPPAEDLSRGRAGTGWRGIVEEVSPALARDLPRSPGASRRISPARIRRVSIPSW